MKIESVDPDISSESVDVNVKKSSNDDDRWLQTTFNITKGSNAKQLTVGGLSGWCTGYLFTKIGKIAAGAMAGSIILFQLAQYRGYIKVNWNTVNKDLNQAKKKLENHAKDRLPYLINKGQRFVEENIILMTGFAGGFLLGLASA